MNHHLELFGWCWIEDIKTFWVLSWNTTKFYIAALILGKWEGKWVFNVLKKEKWG